MVEDIMRTLHAYRELNASSTADIPATGLYVHAPRLKDDKYWVNSLVMEGSESGMYKSTMASNGQMSDWRAEPVLVLKDESDPWAEQRLTLAR
ncbi:hypothetical protein E4U51_004065 [Claviceps purpurea]|nr:hypothetical protein E4U51_004065 [Claviceps purpurea]